MGEREQNKEKINKGDLYFLFNNAEMDTFSGYGLTTGWGNKANLVGLLMVDRPYPVEIAWLRQFENTFGGYQLVPMSATGERGIVCQMQIDPDSISYLVKQPFEKSYLIQEALKTLLDQPPKPCFLMQWDSDKQLWRNQIQYPNQLPQELRSLLEKTGYGCLAVEADIGVVHVCHAPDFDIAGFADKPVVSRLQLIKMPSAPLIRLELVIMDDPVNPFRFESFLNVAEEDQANILTELVNQESLYLAFYGDDFSYRYSKTISHNFQQWQLLDELTEEAKCYWESIPQEERNYDKAKATFIRNN